MAQPLLGGILIGISVSLMLLLNGRVTGISGIVNGLLNPEKGDISWRVSLILGLLLGGAALKFFSPDLVETSAQRPPVYVIAAGLIVGFGTVMGSGCTSGHGVCGVSRLSIRSLLATAIFMSTGILTTWILRLAGVMP